MSGTVHLREGLIADNTATQNGGGVYCGGGNSYFGDQIMVQNNSALLGSSCYSTANAWFLGGTFESGKQVQRIMAFILTLERPPALRII